jgi:hypothetical protein
MKNPEALTFRIPKGLFRSVVGKLYLLRFHFTGEAEKKKEDVAMNII